jgi:hypothetical protein
MLGISNKQAANTSGYEIDDRFVTSPGDPHTTPELVAYLESNPNAEIDARIIGSNKREKSIGIVKMDRAKFIETWKKNQGVSLREAGVDYFGMDSAPFAGDVVGSPDFIPLLGGPFYKQQYYYDYIRGHQQSFYAYHHDPIANSVVQIVRDFTLGRDWKVTSDNKAALALWEAFCEVNDFDQLMESIAIELSVYGEEMIWWLPNNDTKIGYRLGQGQAVPKGLLPRIRLIDPSAIWEIVTYPEDITRVLWYQWVAPTQYQTYTGNDKGSVVPSTKFIYQQIPAEQVMHFKINTVSNEKRGRSDLYPVLGYLKRLRDSVNYSIIGLQKSTAWSIDTTIEGSQSDIDAYVQEQQSLGTIPTAGSEFVHTSKVTREYLANQNSQKGGGSSAFDWCLSMIAAGTGIPVQYFGTHLSGAQTRASALVATEPVAKKFEMRQQVYRKIIKKIAKRLFEQFNIQAEIEVTFPEIVVQDRSAKLKDLVIAESQGWISNETAADVAAKELQIHDYVYEEEQEKVVGDMPAPLTAPGGEEDPDPETEPTGGVSADDRRKLSMTKGM